MNYLAHLFFAKPNSLSLTGNLMGDFTKGVDLNLLPQQIIKGIENHRFIDKFTDSHHLVKQLKPILSKPRRRFSGVISDVVFDHFLVLHWQQFSTQSFTEFTAHTYKELTKNPQFMPERMKHVVNRMVEQDWLGAYAQLEITGRAIDSIANRIRFKNDLHGAISEVELHYEYFQQVFIDFFPQLIEQVKIQSIEQN